MNAEGWDQHEAGQHGAGDRSHGVRGVDPAHGFAQARRPPRGHRHGARKRGAEQQRDGQEDDDAEAELNPQHELGGLRPAQRGQQDLGQALERHDDRNDQHPDPGLERGEGRRGGPARPPEPGVESAPGRETQQERHEHRREGVGRAAEQEGQGPRPGHLVEHRDGPRDAEGHHGEPDAERHRVGSRRLPRIGAALARRRRTHLHRWGRPAAAIDERRDAERHVQRGGGLDRRAVAEPREQHVARRRCAEHRAACIDRVEPADEAPHAVLRPGQRLAQHRERRAHQRRRQQQQRRADRELDPRQDRVGPPQRLEEVRVPGGAPPEEQREQGRPGPGAELEPAVGPDRAPDPARQAPEHGAAQREPAHEDDQHRRDGVHRVAEDQPEHPERDDLVHESRRAREEETKREEAHHVERPWLAAVAT